MITFFIIAFLALSFCQPTKHRCMAALCFSIPLAISDYFSGALPDIAYYVGDALTCGLAVILLCAVSPFTRMVRRIQIACILGVVFNGWGLLVYYFALPAVLYEGPFYGLYSFIILAMLATDEGDYVGGVKFSARLIRNRLDTLANDLCVKQERPQ